MADVQWVFHNSNPEGANVTLEVLRAGSSQKLNLTLPSGWRKLDDIAWRVSSWPLRK